MLIRAQKPQLTQGATLVGALEALVTQKWAAHVVNGQTVLTTAEAGGSVTLTFDRAYTPAELAVMAEEALEWVSTLAGFHQVGVSRTPDWSSSSRAR
jgi:plastocyanin